MSFKEKLLKSDKSYGTMVSSFTRKDGILAIVTFLVMIIIDTVQTHIMISGLLDSGIKYNMLKIIVGIVEIIFVVLILHIEKQPWKSIGVSRDNWKASMKTGFIVAMLLVTINLIIIHCKGANSLNDSDAILKMFVMFFVLAIPEEVIYRGYIHTRIHGIIKNRYGAIIVSSIMFAVAHFPAKLVGNSYNFSDFIVLHIGWILNLVIVDLAYNYVYRKSNSLSGSLFAHCIVNVSYSLLV